MQRDFTKWANGFVDSFTFDNGYNITVSRHDGIVTGGRIWKAIVWDSMNNVVQGPDDLYTYREVADYIDNMQQKYGVQ